jgi:hypothetical protein
MIRSPSSNLDETSPKRKRKKIAEATPTFDAMSIDQLFDYFFAGDLETDSNNGGDSKKISLADIHIDSNDLDGLVLLDDEIYGNKKEKEKESSMSWIAAPELLPKAPIPAADAAAGAEKPPEEFLTFQETCRNMYDAKKAMDPTKQRWFNCMYLISRGSRLVHLQMCRLEKDDGVGVGVGAGGVVVEFERFPTNTTHEVHRMDPEMFFEYFPSEEPEILQGLCRAASETKSVFLHRPGRLMDMDFDVGVDFRFKMCSVYFGLVVPSLV